MTSAVTPLEVCFAAWPTAAKPLRALSGPQPPLKLSERNADRVQSALHSDAIHLPFTWLVDLLQLDCCHGWQLVTAPAICRDERKQPAVRVGACAQEFSSVRCPAQPAQEPRGMLAKTRSKTLAR